MIDIVYLLFSTAADFTTYLYDTSANLCAKTKLGAYSRELVPGLGGTSSAACAFISAAASCLLVDSLILLLKATLHNATSWHERYLRLFLRVTLLSSSTADRTYTGSDNGYAGTRQANPTSSNAPVQPSLAFPLGAGRRRNVGGKRPGDDGSDAEGNDRGKRPRVDPKDPEARVRCPFKEHDPDNPEYEKCGTFKSWSRYREHLLDRKHKPRDRCPVCGDVFTDDVEWGLHTSARTCESSPRALERPSWVERDQATRIRNLAVQGRKNEKPLEEMHRDVCMILFGHDNAPDRTVWAHPTRIPQVQHTGHRLQEPWGTFKRTIANLLGMHNIPADDAAQQVVDYVASCIGVPMEQTHVVLRHDPELGEAGVNERLGNNETITQEWMPPAPPLEGQVPQIPGRDRYATEGSNGELEHSLSDRSTYLWDGAGNFSLPASLGPAQAFSVGHKLEKLDHVSDYVNPAQLQRTDAHHIHLAVLNDSSSAVPAIPTYPALLPVASGSQASDATVLGSSSGQNIKDTDSLDDGEIPDSLDTFDFSVKGYNPNVGLMNLSDDGAPE